ncbi:hypothetical protein LQK36_004045, partial [Vibrio vulnificus]|nr:hypothetical protein [Vibrio vulnificus]
KADTKEQRKNSKKTLVTMLKKHDFLIKYEDFCFYLKQPETQEKPEVTAKKEEKAQEKPAAQATENAAESTESSEKGFNGLSAWQDVLKRPEIDFELEAETIFINEKTEEELLDELDF